MGMFGGKILLSDLAPGIYLVTLGGLCELAFAYEGGDLHLSDIFEYFELGEVLEEDGAPGIELDAREIKKLHAKARDYARDHPPEFIAMCQALVQSALKCAADEEVVCFYENF